MPRPGDCDPSERLHDIARQTIAHPATSPRMANASISKRAFMIDTSCAKMLHRQAAELLALEEEIDVSRVGMRSPRRSVRSAR